MRKLQDAGATSVLITGESGTGKELIARAIHAGSGRGKSPFIPVNCSAIPSELAESELFGHVRGAFTGANTSRKGYFELADGGTLFLDEIGDMPLELQAKLLRVLDNGCFVPVGDTREKHVDVRVLAATNADLQARITEGTFREDLYFRLDGFRVTVPPLRERKEDIPLLVLHFLKLFATEMVREQSALSTEALEALKEYHFPGNIRELKNVIERAIINSGYSVILPEHLGFFEPMVPEEVQMLSGLPEQAFSLMLKGALAETDGNVEAAAQLLEIEPARIEQHLQVERSEIPHRGEMKEAATPYSPQSDEEKRILTYVKEHGSISNAECRDFLAVDLNHASYLLKKMHRYGLLQREGERRWSRYCLA